jgi:hypothetical protein
MVRQRNDNHSTEFGLWLRGQLPNQKTNVTCIESDINHGYVTTNLDYVWYNYNSGKLMLIEEKRYNCSLTYSQNKVFQLLDDLILKSKYEKYYGFHVLRFQKTNPEDGKIFWDDDKISISDLLMLLQFNDIDGLLMGRC